ncbi:TPA: PT domain-containing protein [Streptococcus suis]|nr:LPXTG cell wall anchor domain-containing protein [Streptococcus suis]HEM4136525.1 PT domain-containing protein [Streptococcus suis]
MQAKKFAKWGLALTSTLVLGGVVAPVGGQLLNAPSVVYAQEKTATANVVSYHPSGVLGQYQDIIPLGGSKTYTAPVFDGWEVYAAGAYSANFSWTVKGVDSVTLPEGFTEESVLVEFNYKPMQIRPTEQPADQPAEQPTEQPAEQPAEQPVEQPISVLIGAISEVDGPLSHYYVTIKPGETKTVETPKVDGYKLDQYTSPTYELTYDNALKQLNSAGFAWVQFWMIKDAAPETPVEQPTEQPTEQPAEQPVEQPTEKPAETPTDKPVDTPTDKPVDTPTEKPAETPTGKPVEQLTDASSLTDQTAGKAQAVTATDKKKVDKSAPSTPAVKPEEGSQTTTKTLPKTGDSSSMLLVLGGVLSGLSGLGLAATSRKRD